MIGLLALRAFLLAIGLFVVTEFFLSIIRVTLLTRHVRDSLLGLVMGFVHALFKLALGNRRDSQRQHYALVYEAPFVIILLIATWYAFVIVGFTAIFFAIDIQLVGRSFITSGMSLSTLGSVTGATNTGKYLAIAEGGVGLGIVALLVAWIPVFVTIIQEREDRVSFLAARTGPHPTGAGLIEWYYRAGQVQQLSDSWADWEGWLEDVRETHTSLSLLVLFRSYLPGASWITTAGAVTDAALLTSTTLDVPRNALVEIVLQSGTQTIVNIAAALNIGFERDPPVTRLSVTRAQFDAAYAGLADAGAPVKADRDQAWHDLATLRARYDGALVGLAREIAAPVPPLENE